jgi:hypothetical protein
MRLVLSNVNHACLKPILESALRAIEFGIRRADLCETPRNVYNAHSIGTRQQEVVWPAGTWARRRRIANAGSNDSRNA